MSSTPRGNRNRNDLGIPQQRRADDRTADTPVPLLAGDAVPPPRRDFAAPPTASNARPGTNARSPVRIALIVAAVAITVTAVLGALLGITDIPNTDSTSPSTATEEPLALVGTTASTSSAETRWLTMRDQPPPSGVPESEPKLVIPETGPGEFEVAGAPNQSVPHGAFTYTVEVEQNLAFSPSAVANLVDSTLTDARSWGTDSRPMVRVDTAPAARVILATPETADALCAPLQTQGRLSCRNGANVVLNAWRWVNGTRGYTNLLNYRRYVINHEVGHALGYAHIECPGPGTLAPVMLQQSLGLDGCRPNPWPDPAG